MCENVFEGKIIPLPAKGVREVANVYFPVLNMNVSEPHKIRASSKNGEMGLYRPDLDSVVMLKSNF